jgi:hypothetical protein
MKTDLIFKVREKADCSAGMGLSSDALLGVLASDSSVIHVAARKNKQFFNQPFNASKGGKSKQGRDNIDKPSSTVKKNCGPSHMAYRFHNGLHFLILYLGKNVSPSIDLLLEDLIALNMAFNAHEHNQISPMKHRKTIVDGVLYVRKRLIRATVIIDILQISNAVSKLKKIIAKPQSQGWKKNSLIYQMIQSN